MAMETPRRPGATKEGSGSSCFLHYGGMAILSIKNLPDPLYRKLKQRAKQQHRSVAQEVTAILERVLSEPDALSLLELDGLGRELWTGIGAARHVDRERAS